MKKKKMKIKSNHQKNKIIQEREEKKYQFLIILILNEDNKRIKRFSSVFSYFFFFVEIFLCVSNYVFNSILLKIKNTSKEIKFPLIKFYHCFFFLFCYTLFNKEKKKRKINSSSETNKQLVN